VNAVVFGRDLRQPDGGGADVGVYRDDICSAMRSRQAHVVAEVMRTLCPREVDDEPWW
jgi:hypothetical protein